MTEKLNGNAVSAISAGFHTVLKHREPARDNLFEDVGEIQLHFEEPVWIGEEILNLDTIKDKLTFVAFAMNIYITSFLVGWTPNYFYVWYTMIVLYLIPYRWYYLKQMRHHYIMLDFCYFGNVVILIYLWAPSQLLGDTIQGYLFPVCFAFSMAPLCIASIAFHNALVLHSTNKMTQLIIHTSPAFALWGILQYSTEDQGFPLCAYQTEPGVSGCQQHVGYFEVVLLPVMGYYLWQILYIIIVEFLCERRIREKGNVTFCTQILKQGKKAMFYPLYNMFGQKHQKPMFYVSNALITTALFQLGYTCYYSKYFCVFIFVVSLISTSYNGASYYIDVFSQHYYSKHN